MSVATATVSYSRQAYGISPSLYQRLYPSLPDPSIFNVTGIGKADAQVTQQVPTGVCTLIEVGVQSAVLGDCYMREGLLGKKRESPLRKSRLCYFMSEFHNGGEPLRTYSRHTLQGFV